MEPSPIRSSVDTGAGAFLSARAREVAEAVAVGRPFVSLAAPTHAGGWIDPAVLVKRSEPARRRRRSTWSPPSFGSRPRDVTPRSRRPPDLTGESGAVVRYALGGDEPIGDTAPWWVAAARVRAPGVDDPAVEKRHPGLGPDAGLAARIRLFTGKPDPRSWTSGIKIEVEPPRPDATDVDLPTVLMLRVPLSFFWNGRSDPAMFRWMATIQPGYREAWSAIGALLIARNVDWWSAEWANRAFLEPFLEPFADDRAARADAARARARGRRRPASGVSRPTSPGWRSRTVGLTAAGLAEGLTATVALELRSAEPMGPVARRCRAQIRTPTPRSSPRRSGGPCRPSPSARRRSSSRCSGSSTSCWPGPAPRPSRWRAPVPRAPRRRGRSGRPPRPIDPVPRLTVDRTQAPPALDRSTVLGRRQRPVAEFDECVVGGQAPHRRPDRIGADPVRVLGGGFGRTAHRPGPSREDLEARHVGLARAARDAVTPRDRQPRPMETDADGTLAFAELDDVAVDRRSTRPFHERSHHHEGHDDRDDERHHAESRAIRRCRSSRSCTSGRSPPISPPAAADPTPPRSRRNSNTRKRTIPIRAAGRMKSVWRRPG